MLIPTTRSAGRRAGRFLTALALAAGLMTAFAPAKAATSGHLRGPFSYESRLREMLDYAAEEREERSWSQPYHGGYRVGAWRAPGRACDVACFKARD